MTTKPITLLDFFNSIILVIVGFVIVLGVANTSLINIPHSGFLMLGGLGVGLFGVIRFIVKFFKQPFPNEVDT